MPVITKKVDQLEYLMSEGISVPHCFTTRFGGVSRGYLDSMNIGIRRGDVWENVLKNYEILGEALGFDVRKVVLSHQTHTDTVFRVGRQEWGAGLYAPELAEGDALVTNEPGTALVIFTADCTPILLHDPVTGAVGAAHAGWRGTAAAIAAKTVETMVPPSARISACAASKRTRMFRMPCWRPLAGGRRYLSAAMAINIM